MDGVCPVVFCESRFVKSQTKSMDVLHRGRDWELNIFESTQGKSTTTGNHEDYYFLKDLLDGTY